MSHSERQPVETAAPEPRVTTLELFFDLVFVFTITQLTSALSDEPTWTGVLEVSVMLGIIYWMYGGYVWLTNSVAVDRLLRRLILLGGMAGFLVVALAVPQAFSGAGEAFGLAYMSVIVIHLGMFARASRQSVADTFVGLIPFNLAGATLVLAGGIAGGDAQYVLWTAAFALMWISPKLTDDSGFEIQAGHFVERHGLVMIIAIGESIIAVGIGASGLPVDFDLVLAGVLGLALSACLWWAHFGDNEELAEERMESAPMRERPRLAIHAFGYWHLLLLLGVVAIAAALKETTAHPFDELKVAKALALGLGVAGYLIGEVLFRRTLQIGQEGLFMAGAIGAAATIPVGLELNAAAQVAVLVTLLAGMLAMGTRQASRPSRPI